LIKFDGSNDFLANAMVVSQPLTVLVLWREDTNVEFDLPFYSTSIAGGVVIGSVSNTFVSYAGTNLLSGAITANSANLGVGVINGASSVSWLNGSVATSGNAGANNINVIRLCSNFAETFYPDSLGQVLVFPYALTPSLNRRAQHAAALSFKIPCN